jgi:hypothetical protein
VVKAFRARIIGNCSPAYFFWGSFELALTRLSGRRAPERAGADRIARTGYSNDVISCSFWPGSGSAREAVFYAYATPAPVGLELVAIRPASVCYGRGWASSCCATRKWERLRSRMGCSSPICRAPTRRRAWRGRAARPLVGPREMPRFDQLRIF